MSTDAQAPSGEPARRHGGQGVPRWPAAAAVMTIGGIYAFVSERLTVGPPWLLFLVVAVLVIPLRLAVHRGQYDLAHRIGLTNMGVVTTAVVASTVLLVVELPSRSVPAPTLLQGAALLWVANVLTFAVWYWEIDAGGPARRRPGRYSSTDFLFPQLVGDGALRKGWSPGFLDYLFLAFTTSTAFSPTDTMVLSRRAKVLMMAQSLISLVIIAVLAARAIGTL